MVQQSNLSRAACSKQAMCCNVPEYHDHVGQIMYHARYHAAKLRLQEARCANEVRSHPFAINALLRVYLP